jgi:hypothetical protein
MISYLHPLPTFLAPLCLAAVATAQLDYAPTAPEVVLNTDFTQIQPTTGPALTVVGGVFQFRNVTISQGVRVVGVGSRQMLWICTGTFRIDGEMTVSGFNGQTVNTLNSANFPSAGGLPGAGAGSGGRGSPSAIQRDPVGEDGFGPTGMPWAGGRGGRLACTAGCVRASAGGGGTFGTAGDPGYPVLAGPGTSFQQMLGIGGQGCLGASGSASRSLAGGLAGTGPFVDGIAENDFFGTAIDVFRRRLIVGELPVPVGGSGGGGGGDSSVNNSCALVDPNFANDPKGGGGGGGGGCLVIYAQRGIVVGPTGVVTANGGHGGGGEQAGSCNYGSGGGGGSGGMLILVSENGITLHVKGETFANNDYNSVLSADGGVCTTGTFSTPVILSKYPANGTAMSPSFGTNYDSAPLGGFGGLGLIQLVARPGNNSDGTNTYLDDGITLIRNGVTLGGAQKQRFLGWRGWPDASGMFADDFGFPILVRNGAGDMRPSPILIPILQ